MSDLTPMVDILHKNTNVVFKKNTSPDVLISIERKKVPEIVDILIDTPLLIVRFNGIFATTNKRRA